MAMRTSREPIEVQGKTVEAAVERGLIELDLKRHEVRIEILKQGSRGVLGIGAEDALVRLIPHRERPKSPDAAADRRQRSTPPPLPTEREREPAARLDAPDDASAEQQAAPDDEALQLAEELLSQLLELLGLEAKVVARHADGDEEDGDVLLLDVQGRDLGVLIGRRGETLASLQFLVRLMVNNHLRRWVNLVVDVEGYKARRERMLKELALRMAERAVSTGRVVSLEAMPARERRIIHIALRQHEDVTTQSIGEGESRKVTIIPR
jgi:spoIIIJ-associated protein